MEEVWRAPRINQFAQRVDAIAVGSQEVDLFRIISLQSFRDLRVCAHGIATEGRAVLPDDCAHIFEDCGRGQIRGFERWFDWRRG